MQILSKLNLNTHNLLRITVVKLFFFGWGNATSFMLHYFFPRRVFVKHNGD